MPSTEATSLPWKPCWRPCEARYGGTPWVDGTAVGVDLSTTWVNRNSWLYVPAFRGIGCSMATCSTSVLTVVHQKSPWQPPLTATSAVKLPEWDMPMLAKTHGQPASPTNLAKEFKVRRQRPMLDCRGGVTPHACELSYA